MTTTTTALDLDAIKARHFAARDGEWKTTTTQEDNPVVYVDHESIRDAVTVLFEADWGEPADAEFIANAHQDVPALIAEVERLRSEISKIADAAMERTSKTAFNDAYEQGQINGQRAMAMAIYDALTVRSEVTA